jgi:hypothetical protein
MNRFGLNELPEVGAVLHLENRPTYLTLAYLHWWDKGKRIPADLAARLIEDGYDVEALEKNLTLN